MKDRRLSMTETVTVPYEFYFSRPYWPRATAPNICCRTCYNGLQNWHKGKIKQMPFGVPMTWFDSPGQHDSAKCYACVNHSATKKNSNQLKDFKYLAVPSVELTMPHSDDVPVPKRPSPQTAAMCTADDVQVDAPSIAGPSPSEINPSVFSGAREVDKRPILLTEARLNAIARKLGLSKHKAEMLASEMQNDNLLAEGVTLRSFRYRNDRFKQFFLADAENKFVHCKDINGLMAAMNIGEYKADEWRLFIDSSQSSLKGMRTRCNGGNDFHSIPFLFLQLCSYTIQI